MDPKNLFFSRNAALLLRLDHVCLLACGIYFLVGQYEKLDVAHFLIALAWQDLISFYPAAAVYYLSPRRNGVRSVPRGFYVLYNIAHGVPLNMLVMAVWWTRVGGWEPAMLAFPIHLCIDRGLAGRYLKSFSIAFEPTQHELFAEFAAKMARRPVWAEPEVRPDAARSEGLVAMEKTRCY